MSERRERAEATLRAHGLDPARLATDALAPPVVEGLIDGDDGPAVAEALGEVGGADAAGLLASLDCRDPPRRKAVRRALHRLQERGIAIPAPRATVAHVPAAPIEREAWVSAVDGDGARLAWLASPLPSGALLLVAAELNEPGGLTDLRTTEVSRKQLRAARRELHERGLHLVTAPFEVVDALVTEGQARRGSTIEHRLDYVRVRERLTSEAPLAAEEPRSARAGEPDDDELDTLVAASAALLAEPELTRWWPRPDAAEPFLRDIEEVEQSPIVLSQPQQEARLAAALARATEALYPPDVAARRLRATAYVLAETDRAPAARTALAVARVLERSPARLRDVPLFAALTHQGLGRLAAARAARQRSAREGSLVVTPGEALKARSPGHRERTRS